MGLSYLKNHGCTDSLKVQTPCYNYLTTVTRPAVYLAARTQKVKTPHDVGAASLIHS